MGVTKQMAVTSAAKSTAALPTTASPSTAAPRGGHGPVASHPAHHLPLASKHYGTLMHPGGILLATGAEEAGGAGGAIAALAHHRSHVDIMVSVVLLAILLCAGAMVSFFWKKYKSIHARSTSYGYSQLSQCERDSAEANEIADDLGLSMSTSTDEEDLEPASPATIPVTASYITPKTTPLAASHHNDNDDDLKDLLTGVDDNINNNNNVINMSSNSDDMQPVSLLPAGQSEVSSSLLQAPVPILAQMPPPLQPEPAPPVPRPLYDSDEELLQ